MTNRIDSFVGKYRFLSNFFPAKVELDGEKYPTVEHAFQAAKSSEFVVRKAIQMAETPGLARSLGRSRMFLRDLRLDWERVKVDIMLGLLHQKFSEPIMRSALRDTGDAELVEVNTWGDTFWGVCGGKGENMLGILLMVVREGLK